jgi:protein required for attachment to host cells
MEKSWIVLANAARARILERDPADGALAELTDFVHPQSRQKASELASDRPGHAQKAHGDPAKVSTAFEPRTDLRRKEHEEFARQLAQHLDDAVAQRRCTSLVLIASNPFLGELRSHLGSATQKALALAVPTDLTSVAVPELTRRVSEVLAQQA